MSELAHFSSVLDTPEQIGDADLEEYVPAALYYTPGEELVHSWNYPAILFPEQRLNDLLPRIDVLSTAEDIYEVLVGACADGTSVSTLCASSQNSPAGNTVLYHLSDEVRAGTARTSR